ncbi:hypothetical protein B1A85_21970 [Chroococcidiopsis sp. TS-821]|nr:hypothetical protein B1A85_21970 [Chroococcidiopsis sp. TS-821]
MWGLRWLQPLNFAVRLSIHEVISVMNDTEIISKFIKVEQGDAELKIFVCRISWPHPHEPASNLAVATALPIKSSTKEIESKILEVLQDKRYF